MFDVVQNRVLKMKHAKKTEDFVIILRPSLTKLKTPSKSTKIASKKQRANGQKYFLAENSEFTYFAISSVFELDLKKSMHWLGPGFKICPNNKLGTFRQTLKNQIITEKLAYLVSDRHPILLLETPF